MAPRAAQRSGCRRTRPASRRERRSRSAAWDWGTDSQHRWKLYEVSKSMGKRRTVHLHFILCAPFCWTRHPRYQWVHALQKARHVLGSPTCAEWQRKICWQSSCEGNRLQHQRWPFDRHRRPAGHRARPSPSVCSCAFSFAKIIASLLAIIQNALLGSVTPHSA